MLFSSVLIYTTRPFGVIGTVSKKYRDLGHQIIALYRLHFLVALKI